jgi:precorrin-6A/cobalt-precorrin-6A reductase
MRPKLLILGGTTEAADLAQRIAGEIGPVLDLIVSLAGRMVTLPDLPGRLRVGGFGGAEGLADYLRAESIKAVIDATHPFAKNISAHAHDACHRTGVAHLMLERPPWPCEPTDNWTMAEDMASAAKALPQLGARAFLTIGRQELDAFRAVDKVWCLVRLIDPPPAPLPSHWQMVQGRPPFSEDDEIDLMRQHAIDLLVTKASGGAATYGKILAARKLGLPVLMIQRPRTPDVHAVSSPDDALAWIKRALFSPP